MRNVKPRAPACSKSEAQTRGENRYHCQFIADRAAGVEQWSGNENPVDEENTTSQVSARARQRALSSRDAAQEHARTARSPMLSRPRGGSSARSSQRSIHVVRAARIAGRAVRGGARPIPSRDVGMKPGDGFVRRRGARLSRRNRRGRPIPVHPVRPPGPPRDSPLRAQGQDARRHRQELLDPAEVLSSRLSAKNATTVATRSLSRNWRAIFRPSRSSGGRAGVYGRRPRGLRHAFRSEHNETASGSRLARDRRAARQP